MSSAIKDLTNEYALDDGFIGRLRYERVFDQEKAERYLATLASLEVGDSISLDLAKLIWHLPVMLKWQLEWADREHPGSELQSQIQDTLTKTVNSLTDIIGVP